jgi:large repetitive protein
VGRYAFFGLLTLMSACSLFTSFGDLSNPPPAAPPSDGSTADDGNDPQDSRSDNTDPDGGSSRSAAYAAEVKRDRPISYWRLEEPSGTRAKDEMGAHDGLYARAPLLDRDGVAGSRGVELATGTTAHIEVPSSAFRFPGNASFTVELWVRLSTFKEYQWLAGTEKGQNPRRGWSLFVDNEGIVRYELWNESVVDAALGDQLRWGLFSTPLLLGAFHHVVMTYNGSALLGFLDGVQTLTTAMAAPAPDFGELVVGCRAFIPGAEFISCLEGSGLDEVALYDHPLSDDRVKAHFDAGK